MCRSWPLGLRLRSLRHQRVKPATWQSGAALAQPNARLVPSTATQARAPTPIPQTPAATAWLSPKATGPSALRLGPCHALTPDVFLVATFVRTATSSRTVPMSSSRASRLPAGMVRDLQRRRLASTFRPVKADHSMKPGPAPALRVPLEEQHPNLYIGSVPRCRPSDQWPQVWADV